MDDALYRDKLRTLSDDYESLCRHCGACCGALDGDPCVHLSKKNNIYHCMIYSGRIGPQRTRSGKVFTCVPINNVRKFGALPAGCAYN